MGEADALRHLGPTRRPPWRRRVEEEGHDKRTHRHTHRAQRSGFARPSSSPFLVFAGCGRQERCAIVFTEFELHGWRLVNLNLERVHVLPLSAAPPLQQRPRVLLLNARCVRGVRRRVRDDGRWECLPRRACRYRLPRRRTLWICLARWTEVLGAENEAFCPPSLGRFFSKKGKKQRSDSEREAAPLRPARLNRACGHCIRRTSARASTCVCVRKRERELF